MKKSLVVLVALVFTAAFGSLLGASMDNLMRVDIPFDFALGQTSLPAGQYVVEIDRISQAGPYGSCLVIRTEDSKVFHRIATLPMQRDKFSSGARLVFNKYNDRHFLAKVESYSLGCELRKTKAEKEMAQRLLKDRQMVSLTAK